MTTVNENSLEEHYKKILIEFNADLLRRDFPFTLNVRVVHDLGISGDDFFEFIELLDHHQPFKNIVKWDEFIPGELSRDSYYVAMARSGVANFIPSISRYYVRKIRCTPLTIRKLDELVYK